MNIIMGDFSAKLDAKRNEHLKPVIGTRILHEPANVFLRLSEFTEANNIILKTTQFQRKHIDNVTWFSPNKEQPCQLQIQKNARFWKKGL